MTGLTVALSLVAGVALAAVGYLGWECVDSPTKKGYGLPVVGITSRTQTVAQYRVLGNRFSAICRPDEQGLVVLAGDSGAAVVKAMLFRENDSLGRRQLIYGLDRPLTSVEKNSIEHDLGALLGRESTILHMPLWVDGVALAYNLACPTGNPGNALRLSSAALSGIFSGAIDSWSHALLRAENSQLADCDQSIRVAARSDDASSTTVFKDYLSKRNSQWVAYKQANLNTSWPPLLLDPCRGRGDVGMATCVAGQPNSIGYVAYSEAKRQGLALAHVQNASGIGFVAPGFAEFTRAAEVSTYPGSPDSDWSHVSITDGALGYPISYLQYALAFRVMLTAYAGVSINQQQVRTVKDYIKTALDPRAQARLERYGAASLPETLRAISLQGADAISYFQ